MKIQHRLCHSLLSALLLTCIALSANAAETIRIGFNLPLSGERQITGESTRAGAELLRDEVNKAGGLKVGNKRYQVEYVYADNQSTPQGAIAATIELITQQKVLGTIGPNASSNAIPAGGINQSFATPMVSPTSTNPKTTLDRPYVFRACFLDNFQGEVMAGFAIRKLKANKAAVLYNIASAYPKGLAEFFKLSFEKEKGEGSVVAFENYLINEKDLTPHLRIIVDSGADVLFLPQYAHELPSIIEQARKAGWDKPILGGDAWESADLMEKCGDLCKGLYFSSHFGAIGTKGKTREFVDQYQQIAGHLPTGYAALGYDATKILLDAIAGLDELSPNLLENRRNIKDKIAALHGFEGVSGTLDMNVAGDPAKSAVIIRINDKGQFEAYQTVIP